MPWNVTSNVFSFATRAVCLTCQELKSHMIPCEFSWDHKIHVAEATMQPKHLLKGAGVEME